MDSTTDAPVTPTAQQPATRKRARARLLIAGAVAVATAVIGGLAFAFSGGAAANETACANALQEILRGDRPMAKPAACRGISDDRMGELSFHGSPQAADEAAAEEAAEASVPATGEQACRADLKEQLAGVTSSSSYSISRRNAACDGVDDATMKRMAATIIYWATR